MFCSQCGRQINDNSAFCPYCGMPQSGEGFSSNSVSYPGQDMPIKRHYNVLCIVGFAVSLVSLFLNFFGIVGIAGLILSITGLVNCRRRNEKGTAFAVIGIVAGAFSILWAVIALVGMMLLFFL